MNFIILKFLVKSLWFLKQFYEEREKEEWKFSVVGTAVVLNLAFRLKRNYVQHDTPQSKNWSLQEIIWENHSSLHIKQFFLVVNWKQLQTDNEIM